MSKKPKDELIKELTERGIEFKPDAKYDELAALLEVPAKDKPKRMGKRIVPGKEKVDLPLLEDVPSGYSTTQDHERRLTLIEVALGIKKVESYELE